MLLSYRCWPIIYDRWLALMLPSTVNVRGVLIVICVLVRQILMFGGSEEVNSVPE